MGTIINAQGIYKEDVFDKCSSASTVYASVWAEKQGRSFSPWIPSLSSSFLLILLTVTLINRLRMQVVASALSNHPSGPAFTGACGTVTPGVPTWLVHGLGCG